MNNSVIGIEYKAPIYLQILLGTFIILSIVGVVFGIKVYAYLYHDLNPITGSDSGSRSIAIQALVAYAAGIFTVILICLSISAEIRSKRAETSSERQIQISQSQIEVTSRLANSSHEQSQQLNEQNRIIQEQNNQAIRHSLIPIITRPHHHFSGVHVMNISNSALVLISIKIDDKEEIQNTLSGDIGIQGIRLLSVGDNLKLSSDNDIFRVSGDSTSYRIQFYFRETGRKLQNVYFLIRFGDSSVPNIEEYSDSNPPVTEFMEVIGKNKFRRVSS